MSGFNNQLRVIPRIAWILAVVAYLCLSILLFAVALPGDRHMREWNPIGQILFAFGIPLFVFVFVLLVGYVYGDAKRRGMPYVMWTLLALFIPDGIGIILYFHLAQANAEAVPGLLARCSIGVCILPALWYAAASHVPRLRPWRGARLGELPALRDKIAVTAWSCGLTRRQSALKNAASLSVGGSIFLREGFPGRMHGEREEASCAIRASNLGGRAHAGTKTQTGRAHYTSIDRRWQSQARKYSGDLRRFAGNRLR